MGEYKLRENGQVVGLEKYSSVSTAYLRIEERIAKERRLRLVDFTEGAHPISTKGTIEISGAKRRSDL